MSHGCTGSGCHQGRTPEACDCELSLDVAPDHERVIRAPIRTRTEQEQYLFWKRWSKLFAVAAIAALVALLKLAGAQAFNNH